MVAKVGMNLLNNAIVCTNLVLLMLVMLLYTIHRMDRKSLSDKLFVAIISATIIVLVVDFLSRFDGTSHPAFPFINHVSNFVLFSINPSVSCIWLLFILAWLNRGDKEMKKATRWTIVLNIVNLAIVIVSLFTGWYYTIGPDNIYVRGPYYPVSTIFMLAPLVASYITILTNRKQLESRVFIAMLLFSVPPLIGTLLQISYYGYPFALNSLVISSFILLLYVQDCSIYSDFLTGAGNRRQLYAVVQERIIRSSPGRTFSVIMLDIDNFKAINDNYGHEVGDRVLVETAQMLKASVRSKDYVTRYGGDEFIIVVDISDEESLKTVINRIDSSRRKVNESERLPVELAFSVGSIVYKHGTLMSVDELIREADGEMYLDKKRKCPGLVKETEGSCNTSWV